MRTTRKVFPVVMMTAVLAGFAWFFQQESGTGLPPTGGPVVDEESLDDALIALDHRMQIKREIVENVIHKDMGLLEAVRRVQAVYQGDTRFLFSARMVPWDYDSNPVAANVTDGELFAQNILLYVKHNTTASPDRTTRVLTRLKEELRTLIAEGVFERTGWEGAPLPVAGSSGSLCPSIDRPARIARR